MVVQRKLLDRVALALHLHLHDLQHDRAIVALLSDARQLVQHLHPHQQVHQRRWCSGTMRQSMMHIMQMHQSQILLDASHIKRALGFMHHIILCIHAAVFQDILNQVKQKISKFNTKWSIIGGGDNTWGQNFIRSPPKPDTYHRYKPFCLKDHILLVKKKSFPGNITFWTEMAILTLTEISYIFILAGLGPKWFVFQSWTQRQSCRAHKIGQFCHQDRPSIPLCSKVRDLAIIAFLLAPKW